MTISNMTFNPINGLRDSTYSPTNPVNEAAIRDQIQGISDQLKDFINNTLIPNFGSYATTTFVNALVNSVVLGQLHLIDEDTGIPYKLVIKSGTLYIEEVAP